MKKITLLAVVFAAAFFSCENKIQNIENQKPVTQRPEYAIAIHGGAGVIEVNLAPTAASRLADVALHGPAGQILPRLMQRLK